jgi:hypothetical protein
MKQQQFEIKFDPAKATLGSKRWVQYTIKAENKTEAIDQAWAMYRRDRPELIHRSAVRSARKLRD